MIISNLTDLTFKVTNLYNSLNETIRINDCVDFTAKFYTNSLDLAAISYKHNDEIKNIKITETDDYCLINSSDLQKIGDGVISFYIEYSVEDSNFADGYYNNVIEGNTEYYVDLNINPFDNYYTKEEIDEKLDAIVAGGEIDLSNYYKKSEVDNLLNAKADKSELSTKQDQLISGVNIKTINNQSILGGGNIEIQASTGETDLSDYYTKEECNSTFATVSQMENKVDKVEGKSLISDEEIARLATVTNYDDTAINEQIATLNSSKLDVETYNSDKANFATKTELNEKQNVLISGQNIKTINGNSLLGSGDVTITGGGDIDLSNYYNKVEVDTKLNTKLDTTAYTADKETFALKTELSNYLTVSAATSTYQPIGDYLTSIPDEYITESELSESLNDKVDVTAYTADKETFATKDEIPSEYVLPIASADSLGGVKIGAGLSINSETGVLSATGGGTADSVDWANITSKPTFANVATSGSYNDLSDKPSIPTNISELVNDSNYITNTELTGELSTKLDTSAYTNDKSTFATKDELSNYLTVSGASSTYQPKGDYVTNTELTGELSTKLDTSAYTADKETFALKSEIPNVSNYITKDANNLTYYYNKTETDSKYATTSSIPTKVSQLTNDSNFISSIPSEYVTESELSAKNYATVTEVNNKIDKSQITFSTADPTGGSDGDIWFVYE